MATLVPWDLLTDFERRKYRFRALEILKFLHYNGYRVVGVENRRDEHSTNSEDHSSMEKRFACNLLEKFLTYMDNVALKVQPVKPSKAFCRRSDYVDTSHDVKFFSKILLPLLVAYFRSHSGYFLASGTGSAGATNKEKEMVAGLFARLAMLLRRKLNAFGCESHTSVRCLQVLVRNIDVRTLVKINSDTVRTSLLIFFNGAADDLILAVRDIRNQGCYVSLRGKTLKSWSSLTYVCQVLLPLLTALFAHLNSTNAGQDLLIDEIQIATYKIVDSLYALSLSTTAVQDRKSIKYEIEKHRSAIGQCLRAFASCFPVAFLEPDFNTNNRFSFLNKFHDQSVLAREMLHTYSSNIPLLDDVLQKIEDVANVGGKYDDDPNIFDVHLPMLCSYMTYWRQFGEDGTPSETKVTNINSEYINKLFVAALKVVADHTGSKNAIWLFRFTPSLQPMIPYVTIDPLNDYLLPIAAKIRRSAEQAFKEEERLRTHPETTDENAVIEENSILVRDIYSFYPLLIKFTDLHKAHWLKKPSLETNCLYENVAVVFKIWSESQFEDDVGPSIEVKTGKAAVAVRKKKRRVSKRRDQSGNSIVVACLKRLLPVGLNLFGGSELDILQKVKEKFIARDNEEQIRSFIQSSLNVPKEQDRNQKNQWQKELYQKIGKAQMLRIEPMTQEKVVDKISKMGDVLSALHAVEHPLAQMANAWRKVLSVQRKRAVVACFRMLSIYSFPKHRCINLFMEGYQEKWLQSENTGRDRLISDVANFSDENRLAIAARSEGEELENLKIPDPIVQLVHCFQRAATAERKQLVSINSDQLYKDYAVVMASSIHIKEEDDNEAADEEEAVSMEVGWENANATCNGEPSTMVSDTLQLGIHILNGGNKAVQAAMLRYLQDKRDVQFFSSITGLLSKCSVLNLEIFERQIKAEEMGMGAELSVGEHQNLNDADFICSLFRFLQLTCEGHNNGKCSLRLFRG
ncbi:unnamed protein product [Soboliphyme baturini]|uniref:HECT domain-containing protein n=1 Tax=Soboliphyme baturini TaxID=241478 RepID=A0A183IXB3_9BILA|nr:unnamed protein product [Soboliphyme baturini]